MENMAFGNMTEDPQTSVSSDSDNDYKNRSGSELLLSESNEFGGILLNDSSSKP